MRVNASRKRHRQLHVWLDAEEGRLLALLAEHFGESGSVIVRRLIRVAASRMSVSNANVPASPTAKGSQPE